MEEQKKERSQTSIETLDQKPQTLEKRNFNPQTKNVRQENVGDSKIEGFSKDLEHKQPQNEGDIVSRETMLLAKVYFGQKTSQWNPKMKPYILMTKRKVHIIDIQKTKKALEFAYILINKFAKKGANFIFVGTKKQAKNTIKENALRTNSAFVSERWLGGMLTNNRTIFKRVIRMNNLEKLQENNFEGYTKKEGVMFAKELAKLQKNLNGVRDMKHKPNVMIVANPKTDEIAVKEAKKMGMKVIGIVDTDVNPMPIDVVIPANDDSTKSIALIITILADAIVQAKGGETKFAYQPNDKIILPEEIRDEKKFKNKFGNRTSRFSNRTSRFSNKNIPSFKKDTPSEVVPKKMLPKKEEDIIKVDQKLSNPKDGMETKISKEEVELKKNKNETTKE